MSQELYKDLNLTPPEEGFERVRGFRQRYDEQLQWRTEVLEASVQSWREDHIDTTLTPLGTQYGATLSKAEKGKPSKYAGFACPCKPLQHRTDHS